VQLSHLGGAGSLERHEMTPYVKGHSYLRRLGISGARWHSVKLAVHSFFGNLKSLLWLVMFTVAA
jgi:hypothetical protein